MLGDMELLARITGGESDRVEFTASTTDLDSHDMQDVPGATVDADLDVRAFEKEYLPCAVSPEVLEENRRDRPEQLQALRLVAQNGAPTRKR